MKRNGTRLASVCAAIVLHLGWCMPTQAQGFVTLAGRRFMLNGQEFYPRVLNYSVTILTSNATPEQSMPNDLFLSPQLAYGNECDTYEPTTPSGFTQQFQDEFATIISMGFNTLRLIVNPHIYKEGAARKFRLHVKSPLYWDGEYVFDNSAPIDPAHMC